MKYDDTDYLINREESIEYKINLTKEQSIELLKSTLSKFEIRGEQLYLLKNAVENVLEEQKQKDKRIKELEEENKLLLNSKVGIDLSYDDYISKQKVKDKIEENNKLIEKCKNDEEHYSEIYVYKHDNEILEELLEEK